MAKRKGPSTSSPRARKKAAKEGRNAKEAERGADDKKFDQLRRKFCSLEGKRTKLLEKEHTLEVQRPELEAQRRKLEARKRKLEEQGRKLEAQRRKLEEQEHMLEGQKHRLEAQEQKLEEQQRKLEEPLPPLRSEVEQLQQRLLPESIILKDLCSAREVESAQRLDKLPQEVWERIIDELDDDDLFPLALSCRYFREKQKELVARSRQSGSESGKPLLALRTDLKRKLRKGQTASADYLRFCSKEKVLKGRNAIVRRLAAFHGHLPLLQELLKPSNNLPAGITNAAGESSFSQSLCLLCRDF